VTAQSQFTHGLFQAYYTVISRKFLLLGIALPAFFSSSLAKEERKLDYPLCCDLLPHRLEVCSCDLFVSHAYIPLCFKS